MLCLLTLGACAPAGTRAGRRAMARGDFEAAAHSFEEAAREEPEEPARWLALARAELMAERPARARAAWARLAALRPSDPRPIVEMGFTHELERSYDQALRSYRRAITVAPEQSYPYRVTGTRLLRWGQPEPAIEPLRRAIELEPRSSHDAETRKALALALFHSGDVSSAETEFETAIARHPRDVGLRLGLAALLIGEERHEDALGVYDAVIGELPRFAPAHVGRGILLHELGRPNEAEAAFLSAVEVAERPARYLRRLEEYRALRLRSEAQVDAPPRGEQSEPGVDSSAVQE